MLLSNPGHCLAPAPIENTTIHICNYYSKVRSLRCYIKTHDSESRGQEEAGRTRRTSESFTRSTALKFVNALNKPP